jgi:hypothetical protein
MRRWPWSALVMVTPDHGRLGRLQGRDPRFKKRFGLPRPWPTKDQPPGRFLGGLLRALHQCPDAVEQNLRDRGKPLEHASPSRGTQVNPQAPYQDGKPTPLQGVQVLKPFLFPACSALLGKTAHRSPDQAPSEPRAPIGELREEQRQDDCEEEAAEPSHADAPPGSGKPGAPPQPGARSRWASSRARRPISAPRPVS